ncbi:MAG: 16S rRNA (guanine(527)-N(7))-methyltransferase RsmG [Limnochordia bacterium]
MAEGREHHASSPGCGSGFDPPSYAAEFSRWLDQALADPVFSPLASLLAPDVKERIARFVVEVVQANQRLNLTAITGAREAAVKHVCDSLTCLLAGQWPRGGAVCDLGSGGGFPGMVVALARPDLRVRLVDAAGKKVAFLASVVEKLGVGASVRHGRAEELGKEPGWREEHDVVVARAVAPLAVLLEYALPLCRVGGWFIAMKGPDYQDELAASRKALEILGGRVDHVREIRLPLDAGRRALIAVEKERPTPASYPRRPGIPSRRPLV